MTKKPEDNGKINYIRQALEESSQPKSPEVSSTKSISITGDGNIVGDGNSMNIYHGTPIEKKVVVVKTGDGVLTAQQKAKINGLIAEWVETRSSVRRSSSEIAALRSAFNKAMKVNSYHEILQTNYDKAIKWLRRQTGIVNSMASASKKNPNWRNKRYRAINARANQFPNGKERYRQYASDKFGTSSLKEFDDKQLEALYRYVFNWS